MGTSSNTSSAPLPPGAITARLDAWNRGEPGALKGLLPHVYAELRQLAKHKLSQEHAEVVQPTVLVHELYLRLTGIREPDWKNRSHFFGACSTMMRNILVDDARRRLAQKRSATLISLDGLDDKIAAGEKLDVVALDDALTGLAAIDQRQAKIVELRFFTGLSVEETSQVMGISTATVKRDWASAKAWMLRRLS